MDTRGLSYNRSVRLDAWKSTLPWTLRRLRPNSPPQHQILSTGMLRETLDAHSSTSRKLQSSRWTVEVISRIGPIPRCLQGLSHLQLLRTRVPSPPHRLDCRGRICSICSD